MVDEQTLFRGLLVIGLLLLVLPLLGMSFMMLTMGGGMMGGMGAFGFSGFVPLLLALVVIYAGYRLVQSSDGNDETVADGEADPVERLQDQYVGGELTETEFERRLQRHYGSTDGSESADESSNETAERRRSESER